MLAISGERKSESDEETQPKRIEIGKGALEGSGSEKS